VKEKEKRVKEKRVKEKRAVLFHPLLFQPLEEVRPEEEKNLLPLEKIDRRKEEE
jgi:hypothetical protein